MESKYCPACGGFHNDGCCNYPNGEEHTWCSDILYNPKVCDTCKEFATCQSPNRNDRQQPVEPPNEITELHEDILDMANVYRKEGFAAGRAAALREAKESVRILIPNVPTTHPDYKIECALSMAIDAIESLEVKP